MGVLEMDVSGLLLLILLSRGGMDVLGAFGIVGEGRERLLTCVS